MYVILMDTLQPVMQCRVSNQRPSRKPDAVSVNIIPQFASLNRREACFTL